MMAFFLIVFFMATPAQATEAEQRATRIYASAGDLERLRTLPQGERSELAYATVTPTGIERFKPSAYRSWALHGMVIPIFDAINPNMVVGALGAGGRFHIAPNMAITPYLSMSLMGGMGGPSSPFLISRLSTGVAFGKVSDRRIDGAITALQLIDLNSYDNPETNTRNGHAELHVVAMEIGYWF